MDCQGIPIFINGPHYGAMHDIKMWTKYGCRSQMQPNEQWLADLGYKSRSNTKSFLNCNIIMEIWNIIGHPELVTGYKAPLHYDIQRLHNQLLGWHRSPVNVYIEKMKKFSILGEEYRGRLMSTNETDFNRKRIGWTHLERAITIISNCLCIELTLHPYRQLPDRTPLLPHPQTPPLPPTPTTPPHDPFETQVQVRHFPTFLNVIHALCNILRYYRTLKA